MINQILSKLGIELDDKEKKLLSLLLEEEPVTAYRLASDGKMHFSYVYKKLDRFEREELVTYFCEPESGRKLYYAMPKGVITAMAYGLSSQRLLVEKLKNKWGLSELGQDDVLELVGLLAQVYRPGFPINDIVMTSYYLYIKYLSGEITIDIKHKNILNILFRRALEAFMGLLGEDCIERCKAEIASRDFFSR